MDENNVGVDIDINIDIDNDIDVDIYIDVNIVVDEKNIDVDMSRNPPLVRCEAVIGQAALRMNYSFFSTNIALTELYQ